jgi:hypothetical protein
VTFLLPLAGLFALSLPVIVVLHMRRSRPRPLPVTTLRFWQEATRHQRQRLAWRRPARILLLLAQLLIAALLTLALARPALPVDSLPGDQPARQLIVVLDRSTAMRATDVAPSRFETAKARARELVRGAPADEQVALLTLGGDPQLYRSRDAGDRPGLLAALEGLGPGGGRADLNAALPMLRATLLPERENRIVLLSGGSFAAPPDHAALTDLPATLDWERIGDPAPNVAITRLVSRPSAQAPDRVELFASVANYAPNATRARSRIEADGALVDDRTLSLPAGGALDLVWQLPRGTRGARLRVEGADAMPLDNEAQVVLREASQVRVLLVSDEPGDLERALAAQPGATLTVVRTDEYRDRERYDLTVFERYMPESLPRGSILLVTPPPDNPLIPANGVWEIPRIVRANQESPLLAGVDLSGVSFAAQYSYETPPWATEVVGSEAGSLIVSGREGGRQVVALTFDLAGSSLPRKLAFPLLIGNIVHELQTHRVPVTAPLGVGVLLEPVAGTARAQLRGPEGRTRDLELEDTPGGTPAAFAVLEQPGLYALVERDTLGNVILQESFAVNAGDAISSNLQAVPANLPPGRGGIMPAPEGGQTSIAAPRRLSELWPLLLAAAVGLLMLEWWLGLLGTASPRPAPARVAPRGQARSQVPGRRSRVGR